MSFVTTRREMLQQGLAAMVAGGLAGEVLAQAADQNENQAHPLPIIDTHVHLWDLQRFRLDWLTGDDNPLRRNFTIADYQQAIQGCHVVKAVYMEVDVHPSQHVAEAEYIAGVCQQGNTVIRAAVVGGRPAAENFGEYARRFRDHRFIKGIRQVLHSERTPAGYCTHRDFIRGIQLLGDLGLSFDLCMRHAELADGVTLAEACPNTRLVLDHCGNADVQARDRTRWQRDVQRLARCRNVIGKVSGIPSTAPENWTAEHFAPIVNHMLDTFGPERVIFAADWPVCTRRATFRQWSEAVRSIVSNRPRDQQRKLFHDNAARFYGI